MNKGIRRIWTLAALVWILGGGVKLKAQPLRASETQKIRLEQVQLFRTGAVLRYGVSGKLVAGS